MAEPVDGLVDIAHGVEAVGRAQQIQQLRLQPVRILKFIHQDVVELPADALSRLFILFQQARRELLQIGKIQCA